MARRIVRSWDVFDTLISRKVRRPDEIFDRMGESLGEGFRSARMQAEIDARKHNEIISLDDIYDQLEMTLEWTREERQRARDLEIQTEYDNIVPIRENLSRVRDGDLVVSDMYLSEEVIMGLLRAAGLNKQVFLFVSNNGKADGTMWSRLRKDFFILKHTGDNLHSDFLRPIRHGIPAGITEASGETPWERILRCNGAATISAYIREMRLSTFHRDKNLRAVQRSQIEANFPMLLLASAALIHWCDEHDVARALMCSRDCVLWVRLAEKMARQSAPNLSVEYFLTSRVTALYPTKTFLDYATKRITPNSVVVDLSMTGVSLAALADRLGIDEVRAFVISAQRSSSKTLYGKTSIPRTMVVIESLTAEVIDEDLEAINQAPYPSIHDVREIATGVQLTYASENRSHAMLNAVRVQTEVFDELLNRVPESVIAEALALARSTRLVFLVRECARHSASFDTVIARARPGAALQNDPNGVKLNLPYATRSLWQRTAGRTMKLLLRPVAPPGSALYRFGRNSLLILRALKKAASK